MFHSKPLHAGNARDREHATPLLSMKEFSVSSNSRTVLNRITLDIREGEVLGVIGRSKSGKTALLRGLCRMLDESGRLYFRGMLRYREQDIYAPEVELTELRRRLALVCEEPNPFPMTIWDNIAYGARLNRIAVTRAETEDLVEEVLTQVGLWDALKDRLHRGNALSLSDGQKRLLCIARALAVRPDVLLLDKPSGSVDRMDLARLTSLVCSLRRHHTIVVVTPSLTEAAQISDRVAFMDEGQLIEVEEAEMMFTAPLKPRTQAFISSTDI